MRIEIARLFSKEVVVYKNGVEKSDLRQPILVAMDCEGNAEVYDGNHRAKKAVKKGKNSILAKIVGKTDKSLRSDPWRRSVAQLKEIED